MKLGKVIGNVVATIKDPGLKGLRFLIVQGLDDDFHPIGKPFVAADGIFTAGEGDIVYVVSKKEAAFAIGRDLAPIDECIVGFVEEFTVVEAAKKRKEPKIAKPKVETEKPIAKKRKKPPKATTSPPKTSLEKPVNTERPQKITPEGKITRRRRK